MECVDLVALDGLVFFTDGSLCEGIAGAGVLSDILNVRELYAFGSQSRGDSNRVRLVWVPGNCGIHGNEETDALARTGSSSAFVGPEPCLPLAPSSVKRREREWLHCLKMFSFLLNIQYF
jgi:hypothetical protein